MTLGKSLSKPKSSLRQAAAQIEQCGCLYAHKAASRVCAQNAPLSILEDSHVNSCIVLKSIRRSIRANRLKQTLMSVGWNDCSWLRSGRISTQMYYIVLEPLHAICYGVLRKTP